MTSVLFVVIIIEVSIINPAEETPSKNVIPSSSNMDILMA